jgi:hypothetical protein
VVKKFKHGMQTLILFKTLHACKVHPLHSLWLSHSFVQQLGVLGNASHQAGMMLPSPTNSMNKISPTTQVASSRNKDRAVHIDAIVADCDFENQAQQPP